MYAYTIQINDIALQWALWAQASLGRAHPQPQLHLHVFITVFRNHLVGVKA